MDANLKQRWVEALTRKHHNNIGKQQIKSGSKIKVYSLFEGYGEIMITTIKLNKEEIAEAIKHYIQTVKGVYVTKVTLDVFEVGDCFDRPAGHTVIAEASYEN